MMHVLLLLEQEVMWWIIA